MIDVGARVEIALAYDSETHAQTYVDEIAYCEAWVVAHGREGSGYHVVETRDGERHEVHVGRLRQLGRIE